MGDYDIEVFPDEWDNASLQRFALYTEARSREISDIIGRNSIECEDVRIGEKLKLYPPLLERSQIRLNGERGGPVIRSFFDPMANYYPPPMWPLAIDDEFVVYDKRTLTDDNSRETISQIRISRPPKKSLREIRGLFSGWIDIRHFSRKEDNPKDTKKKNKLSQGASAQALS